MAELSCYNPEAHEGENTYCLPQTESLPFYTLATPRVVRGLAALAPWLRKAESQASPRPAFQQDSQGREALAGKWQTCTGQ